MLVWAVLAAALASLTPNTPIPAASVPRCSCGGSAGLVPYLAINTGMLPHQFSSFSEGLFGRLHSEFERTPKAASVDGDRPAVAKFYGVKIHWPYVLTELCYATYQLAWAAIFAATGLVVCAFGALYLAACVAFVAFFYGDHAGKVCFVIDRRTASKSVKDRALAVKKPLRPASNS